ncbi:ABC transporter [Polymorphobacter glacialis]|uniref:ABC transporter n=2 Tax=Sandarakinorhabdus glacialis TaxID=1614636 RepID=A0A916ZWM8_9SPHN|nr:ABC transporter [Polymorphobacter glacialis]
MASLPATMALVYDRPALRIPRPDISLPPAPGDWLRAPLWANRGLFGQVVLAAALINVFALATSIFSMTVYNKIVPAGATDSMTALLIGIVLVLAFDFALRGLRGYFVDVAGQNIDQQLGRRIFDQLMTMKLADRQGSNGAFAGLLREFETLREFFASATITALVDVPFILLFLGVIFWVAPPLALVPLFAIPVVIGIAWASQPLLGRLAQAGLAESLNKQGIIIEAIAGLETIKTSRAGPLLAARWHLAVLHHAALSLRQRLISAVAVNTAATAQNLVYVLTVAIGVSLIADRQLTMGALIAASMLAGRCVTPLGQIAALLTRLSQTLSSYRALDKVMTTPGEGSPTLRRPRLDGGIAFRNVTFRYPGSSARALDDVSFDIAPGERVAIIGRVGSGKSTIARLILGLYEASDGAVMVGDADVRQLHPDDLRANIGAVLQDVVLLSGSIRDNIALGDPAIDDAEVLRASRLSGAHDFIGRMAAGYDRQLADRGEGLSGGQRQTIAIARALTLRRPIMIFDEPTSAMDTASEDALIERLETELIGRTLVLVTHRQSMLRLATRVIMIDAGRIVADGAPAAVLKSLTTV